MDSLCGEPVCLWLPEKLRDGKSEYVQGVEVAPDYKGIIPEGFDVIDLPECDYLMFLGEPFAEEDFEDAITAIWESEKKYDPSVVGYKWDKENPRIQLEPRGERGYIELVAVKAQQIQNIEFDDNQIGGSSNSKGSCDSFTSFPVMCSI